LYFALENAGAGHGTFLFFAPLLTWILVIISIVLLSRETSKGKRFLIAALVGIHYFATLVLVANYIPHHADDMIRHFKLVPFFVLVTLFWYVAGQMLIWIAFFKSKSRLWSVP
jgi:dipeptide/tripeptide permease